MIKCLHTAKIYAMRKKSIYLYILVLFVSSQFVFAQTNSDDFPYITDTPGELIVRLHPNASRGQLEKLSRRLGAVSVFPVFPSTTPGGQHPRLRRTYLIRFPKGRRLETLRRRYERQTAIEAVEMNRLNQPCAGTSPNDPNYGEQWNLSVLNMPQAWDIEQGKPQVTVAVVDSGIATRHPEFRSTLTTKTDGISAMPQPFPAVAIGLSAITTLKMKQDTEHTSRVSLLQRRTTGLASLGSRRTVV